MSGVDERGGCPDGLGSGLVSTPSYEVAEAPKDGPTLGFGSRACGRMRVLRVRDFEEAEPLAEGERDAYRRRFLTLFEDESSRRRGGLGQVSRVTNALGEEFALKVLVLPGREDVADTAWDAAPAAGGFPRGVGDSHAPATDDACGRGAAIDARGEGAVAAEGDAGAPAVPSGQEAVLRAAFREEYAAHRALSGLRGFPRLYGCGEVEGAPAIVMEWVRGETLAHARTRLAIDDEGRMSPLTAARLGRDLFGLISRMDLVGGGYVHRDISPSNVMIRTAALSVEEQAEEGSFDLCLIDFGSTSEGVARREVAGGSQTGAVASEGDAPGGDASGGDAAKTAHGDGFTSVYSVARRATTAYAPPEMLSDDLPRLGALRRSPSIDVYEAASVLYQLVGGALPFDLAGAVSPYRVKTDVAPKPLVSAHAAEGASLAELLPCEPEVAVLVAQAVTSVSPEPTPEDVCSALALVDDQLAGLVRSGLASRQDARPSAEAMRDGLSAFAKNYGSNLLRALRGEPLRSSMTEASWLDSASPFALRRIVRSVGTAIARAIWLVVLVSASMLLSGAPAAFSLGDIRWSGQLSGLAVGVLLALPGIVGLAARGARVGTRVAFARGTVALVASTCVLAGLASRLALVPAERAQGVSAAIFAVFAAAWCPLVLDFATLVVPALIAEARRALPGRGAGAERRSALGGDAPVGIGGATAAVHLGLSSLAGASDVRAAGGRETGGEGPDPAGDVDAVDGGEDPAGDHKEEVASDAEPEDAVNGHDDEPDASSGAADQEVRRNGGDE